MSLSATLLDLADLAAPVRADTGAAPCAQSACRGSTPDHRAGLLTGPPDASDDDQLALRYGGGRDQYFACALPAHIIAEAVIRAATVPIGFASIIILPCLQVA
jgi:hypothetical protein